MKVTPSRMLGRSTGGALTARKCERVNDISQPPSFLCACQLNNNLSLTPTHTHTYSSLQSVHGRAHARSLPGRQPTKIVAALLSTCF